MKKLLILTGILCIIFTFGCGQDNAENATEIVSQKTPVMSSESNQSEQKEGQIKPQQLITKEEAAQLLGEAVKEGLEDEQKMLGINIIYYESEKNPSKFLKVAVFQQGEMSQRQGEKDSGSQQGGGDSSQQQSGQGSSEGFSPKSAFEAVKKVFSDPTAGNSGNIGDDSFITSRGMVFMAEETFVYIAVGGTDDPTETVKQAGNLALRNLKRVKGK
ncbi:MAG TPA: hypothetical protein PLZ84_05720 [Clostridia bacterium]|nr:hypothetical protein [Clostridia bacterium]